MMAIHTFGEYLDFHPHLHALVADGFFDREGKFHVMRAGELAGELAQEQRGTTDAHLAGNHAELEQLFRARVIAFLVEARSAAVPMTSQRQHEMRPVSLINVSLINDAQIIERILRHVGSGGLGQWVGEVCNHRVRIAPSTGPPVGESVAVAGIFERGQLVIEPMA